MRTKLLALLFCIVFPFTAAAVQPDEILKDPKLELRARDLSAGLRCLVCQNQSIDDSNAPLARDLRVLVRERLKAGDSDEQVLKFVVARYGDFILLKPPLNFQTFALWFLPLAILLFAGLMIVFNIRRRRPALQTVSPLNHEEQSRLSDIIDKNTP